MAHEVPDASSERTASALSRSGFHVETDPADGAPVIRLHGELDLATAPRLVEALRSALQPKPASLVVDLRELTFIDSTGIGVLMSAYRRAEAEGFSFVLRDPRRGVLRTLQVTGVAHLVLTEVADPG